MVLKAWERLGAISLGELNWIEIFADFEAETFAAKGTCPRFEIVLSYLTAKSEVRIITVPLSSRSAEADKENLVTLSLYQQVN